ncbi:MAG: hypothetical protein N2746_07660 [Deltaproteobacteria bacterium]|nr:hypothetical protein [Deltaproteobacteria bacterium]
MATKSVRELINNISNLINEGRYKKASDLIKQLDINALSEEEKKKYLNFKQILAVDKVYLLVAVGLILIIFMYFVLVKVK